jgi:hypothetical protein
VFPFHVSEARACACCRRREMSRVRASRWGLRGHRHRPRSPRPSFETAQQRKPSRPHPVAPRPVLLGCPNDLAHDARDRLGGWSASGRPRGRRRPPPSFSGKCRFVRGLSIRPVSGARGSLACLLCFSLGEPSLMCPPQDNHPTTCGVGLHIPRSGYDKPRALSAELFGRGRPAFPRRSQ